MSTSSAAGHDQRGPVAWPTDAHYGTATSGKIGMWVFLLSDALSFAGLLWVRHPAGRSTVWRQPGEPPLGINVSAGLTFLLICSSVTRVHAYAASTEGNRKRAALWLGATALGGLLFLTGQFHEYFGIWHPGLSKEGLVFGQSAYASTFYVITSFHGFHVFSGVCYILVTLVQWLRGKIDAGRIELLGLFWHFVDLVWILVFTFVYLIP
jgi:heme/copper-type cytochrome/quinol oxidase subunit 3